MLCENCGENEANVKYTQVVNGVKKQMNLCDKCANELGVLNVGFNLEMPIDFSGFFGDLLNQYEDNVVPTIAMPKVLSCSKCGTTFDEFLNEGKFGCDNCYSVFENKIDPILKRLHGSNRYMGRTTKQADENNVSKVQTEIKEDEITKLKKELKQKIKEEKYEEAALLRDKIKNLENK